MELAWILLLFIVALAIFPAWSYSGNWGFASSSTLSIVAAMLCLGMLLGYL